MFLFQIKYGGKVNATLSSAAHYLFHVVIQHLSPPPPPTTGISHTNWLLQYKGVKGIGKRATEAVP